MNIKLTITTTRSSCTVVSIYQPGSASAICQIFNKLFDLLARVVTGVDPVTIAGDNIILGWPEESNIWCITECSELQANLSSPEQIQQSQAHLSSHRVDTTATGSFIECRVDTTKAVSRHHRDKGWSSMPSCCTIYVGVAALDYWIGTYSTLAARWRHQVHRKAAPVLFMLSIGTCWYGSCSSK